LRAKTIFAGFAILTLLLGFSGITNFGSVYAEHTDSPDERDAKKVERQQERDAKRDEYKQERDAKRDEYKADKKEAKIKFKATRDEYKKKYEELRDQLKDELRQLKADRHPASEMAAMSSEISEEEILNFEEKRKRLHDLKREFREQILDLKTQARMQTDEMKQKFIQAGEERKNKVQAKLYVLKLKFKDRILDHPITDSLSTDIGSDEKRHVVVCHVPPGNPENEHSIRVSINAVHAHLAHGDALGPCNGEMSDDAPPPDGEQKTIELTESVGISDTE